MVIEVFLDGGFELGEALEDAAANTVLGDPAKEAFDLIEPGSRGRSEVHMEARVPFEPRLDPGLRRGMLVSCSSAQTRTQPPIREPFVRIMTLVDGRDCLDLDKEIGPRQLWR